ncbi:hypothetical protein VP01_5525g1 [Puccinia sorghi]|uniref:Uncharacterized protein n=1 Tax=Puccinia sorghi TaxID=27349 RepID=A0A0L6UJD6_9BASI|nr:hypothetical protein VP01_5525g1 [Puccinia sorghi]
MKDQFNTYNDKYKKVHTKSISMGFGLTNFWNFILHFLLINLSILFPSSLISQHDRITKLF